MSLSTNIVVPFQVSTPVPGLNIYPTLICIIIVIAILTFAFYLWLKPY